MRHASYIAGEARAGERGFDLAAADGSPLGAWPRAGEAELREAARAAREASAELASRDAPRREALLRSLEEALVGEPDPGGLLARRLGLAPEELVRLAPPLARAAALAEAPEAPEARGRPALVRAHWSTLWDGLLAPARESLARGGALLVLADPRAPMLADALAQAARAAGLPPGLVQVIHDDRPDALLALAGLLPEATLEVHAPEDELARARERLERAHGRREEPGFGAGVGAKERVAPRFVRLAAGAAGVRADLEPEPAARALALAAFGRVESLSGQLPASPQRILVAERLFSRFSEALLAALEELPGPPLPLLEPSDPSWLLAARELGLDEGATLLVDPFEGSTARPAGAILPGLVFTNVEPALRLARLARPAPLLRLLRVSAGQDPTAQARALAALPALGPRAADEAPPGRRAHQGTAPNEPMEPGS